MCTRKRPGGIISIANKNPSVYTGREAMSGGSNAHTPDADAMDNSQTVLAFYSRHPPVVACFTLFIFGGMFSLVYPPKKPGDITNIENMNPSVYISGEKRRWVVLLHTPQQHMPWTTPRQVYCSILRPSWFPRCRASDSQFSEARLAKCAPNTCLEIS